MNLFLRPTQLTVFAILIGGLLSLFTIIAHSDTADAESLYADLTPEARAAKEDIINIMDGESFHKLETETGWRLKNSDDKPGDPKEKPEDDEDTVSDALEDFFKPIGKFFSVLFSTLEYILWALAFIIVVALIVYFRVNLASFVRNNVQAQSSAQPTVMFGLEVSKESLPDDIIQSARELWQQGEHRASIALLYRALLAELIHSHNYAFTDSLTEGECLQLVHQRGDAAISGYTSALTQCWQQIAYGHQTPDFSTVESLWRRWSEVAKSE